MSSCPGLWYCCSSPVAGWEPRSHSKPCGVDHAANVVHPGWRRDALVSTTTATIGNPNKRTAVAEQWEWEVAPSSLSIHACGGCAERPWPSLWPSKWRLCFGKVFVEETSCRFADCRIVNPWAVILMTALNQRESDRGNDVSGFGDKLLFVR